jgi:hypothetical protein
VLLRNRSSISTKASGYCNIVQCPDLRKDASHEFPSSSWNLSPVWTDGVLAALHDQRLRRDRTDDVLVQEMDRIRVLVAMAIVSSRVIEVFWSKLTSKR